MLSMTFLHALNAFLSYKLFSQLLRPVTSRHFQSASFFGSVAFLLSPYQTEAVVWTACVHYLVTTGLLLSSWLLMLKYFHNPRPIFVLPFYLLFLLSLFALEIALAFPLMLFIFMLFWPSAVFKTQSRARALAAFVLPLLFLTAVYFLLNKLLLGSWVGHYGASTHLNFSPALLASNFNKYVAKYLAFAQFFPYGTRRKIYSLLENNWIALLSFIFYLAAVLGFLSYQSKIRPDRKATIILFGLFALALSPVINLFFTDVILIEGDRMGYFASAFFYPCVILFLFSYLPKLKYILTASFILLNAYFLTSNTASWEQVAKVSSSLIEKFKWQNASHVYILNIPDNYNVAYIFRSFDGYSALSEHLLLRRNIDVRGKITEVVNYNMATPADSVKVVAETKQKIRLEFAQWGNWFWRNGIGATSYRNEDFQFTPDEWGHSYTLTFDSVPSEGTVFIYQCGDEWRELPF